MRFFKQYRWVIFFALLTITIRLPQLLNLGAADFPEFYRDYYMAQQIVHGHIPLLGPPSMQAHFYFGPIYYYLLAPALAIFNGHPAGLIFTGIILYAFSAIVFYKLLLLWLKEDFGAKIGTLFYCLSIYGVHLTSYTSNPNFLPLFVISFFYFLTKIVGADESKLKDWFFFGLCYSIAAQLHVTAAVVLLLTAGWPLIRHIKTQHTASVVKNFILAMIAASIAALPYLWFELTHKFQNLTSLFNFSQNHLTGNSLLFGLKGLINFFSASLNPFEMKNSYTFLDPNSLYGWVAIAGAISLLLFLRSVFKRKNSSQEKILSQTGAGLSLGWLAAGILLALLFDRGLHDHYLIILWPLPALIVAIVGKWLNNHFGFGWPVGFLIIVISGLQFSSFYSQPGASWQKFFSTYEARYKNNPATPDIGFSPAQW